jgi:cation diffusion facilitator family transporter
MAEHRNSSQGNLAERGMRSTLIGISVNILLAVVKGAAGLLGNSYALIADAVESATDIASSLIIWISLKISAVPPDADHPYGHGKAQPMAAVIVSLTLIGAALAIAVQSIRGILVPKVSPVPYTLVILVVVVAVKEWLYRFVFRVGQDIDSTAVKSDAWHHRSDAITSAAAFVGISIAVIGGPEYASADAWAALFASAIILFNAYRILRPAANELMDAAPPPEMEIAVRRAANGVPGVVALEKCFIRKMGFAYYVDLHVTVDGGIPVRQGHDIASRVRDAIRASNSAVAEVLVHIEPSDLLHQ